MIIIHLYNILRTIIKISSLGSLAQDCAIGTFLDAWSLHYPGAEISVSFGCVKHVGATGLRWVFALEGRMTLAFFIHQFLRFGLNLRLSASTVCRNTSPKETVATISVLVLCYGRSMQLDFLNINYTEQVNVNMS